MQFLVDIINSNNSYFTMFTTRLTVKAARSSTSISTSTSLRLNASALRSFTSTTPISSDQYDVVIIGT
jgi:hypothetical protein